MQSPKRQNDLCSFPRQIIQYHSNPSLCPDFPGGSEVKASASNAGDLGSIPVSGRSPGEGNHNPRQYLPGESHGQRSLVGCSPLGHKESDTTERLHFHFHFRAPTNNAEEAEVEWF